MTKELEVFRKVNYQCPLGKTDHVLIEFEVNYCIEEWRREEHKNGRYNYGKVDSEELNFFAQTDWSSFHATGSTQKKWEEFIRIHMEGGIDRYVP